jgi:beta-glucosidase
MTLTFPDHFIFGTSTSAYQIETAVDHDWCNVTSRDGHRFLRTTDHEQRFREDVAIIASLAPHYRMSLMWSKLQREPLAAFDPHAKAHYHALLTALRNRHVTLMLVIHHFANPVWFMQRGGWTKSKNIALWVDFATKLVDEYGHYVTLWNTFNEPNLYTSLSYALGQFPPYRKNIYKALQVIRNMGAAHNIVYDYIKDKHPDAQVGISHGGILRSERSRCSAGTTR